MICDQYPTCPDPSRSIRSLVDGPEARRVQVMAVPLCQWPRSQNSLDRKTGHGRTTFEIGNDVDFWSMDCSLHECTRRIHIIHNHLKIQNNNCDHTSLGSVEVCAARALLQAVRDMDAEKLLEMAADKVKSRRFSPMGKVKMVKSEKIWNSFHQFPSSFMIFPWFSLLSPTSWLAD